jgi:hypothetical protein
MSEERVLYLTSNEKDLVEKNFGLKLRLTSEAQPSPHVTHPGLKNCSVKCYMNSILQMFYSNPYIQRQIIEVTVNRQRLLPCSPSASKIARACVEALHDLFLLLKSGKEKFYDADGVFKATNASLVARNIANINADKIRKISRLLKQDDLSVEISTIINGTSNDADRLQEIKEFLQRNNAKKKPKKVFESVKQIVEDASEAQQDADEFFLLILECMGCYGLAGGINVHVTYRRFCVDEKGHELKELRPKEDPPVNSLRLLGSNKKESIETLLETTQLPEIKEGWKNEDNECKPGDLLRSKLVYTTTDSFDTLFLLNPNRANLFVPYKLTFTGKSLLLKGACLYSGTGTSGHYVYADIISATKGIVYDDKNPVEVSINYTDPNVDLQYNTFTLSENGYFYMYVIEEGQEISASHGPQEISSDSE